VNSSNRFEVRVPTYRRPDLLQRALTSLVAQEYEDWQAIVLDDSPHEEGLNVVERLDDERIRYHGNAMNLGLIQNLAQAFRTQPFFSSSHFACVLEDDNYYRPSYLKTALRGLEQANVVLENAQIAQFYADGREILQDRFTMSPIFGDAARWIEYSERLIQLSTHQLIGNLCLTWRLDPQRNFEVAEEPYNQIVQEKMRAVCTRESFWYEPQPFAVWTHFPDARSQKMSWWQRRIHNWRWRRSELEVERFRGRELSQLQIENGNQKKENEIGSPSPLELLKEKMLLLTIPRRSFPDPTDFESSCGQPLGIS